MLDRPACVPVGVRQPLLAPALGRLPLGASRFRGLACVIGACTMLASTICPPLGVSSPVKQTIDFQSLRRLG